jgi:hypothetical protein
MKRPVGIIVPAAVMVIAGFAFGLAGIEFFLMGTRGAISAGVENKALAAALAGLGAAAGVIFLLFGVFHVVLAVGLLQLQDLARILSILLFGLSAVGAAIGLIVTIFRFNRVVLAWDLVVMATDVAFMWYLLRPHVKLSFIPPLEVTNPRTILPRPASKA